MASVEHPLFAPGGPDPEAGPAFLAGLSADQRRAVLYDEGPLVILAGPGAGKTRTIVSRVARLVAPLEAGGLGAEPESVLALAFTIKSAEELRERLAAMVGPAVAERVQAMTSHAFGYRIVRRFGDMIGVVGAREGRLADTAQRKRLLRDVVRKHDLFSFERSRPLESIVEDGLDFLNACATDGIFPADARALVETRRRALEGGAHGLDGPGLQKAIVELRRRAEQARMYELFEAARLAEGLITIDDCINLPIRILRECPDAAAILRAELRHAVVDEFQDWNRAQIELLSLLFPCEPGRPAPDVCVVGDDDQSIFGFRGADTRAFERFREKWAGCGVVTLETNYRSAPCIVRTAGALIAKATRRFHAEKRLVEHDGWRHEEPPSVEGCLLKHDEQAGEAVATIIQADRATNPESKPYGRYAVVCRGGADVDRVATALAIEGIPVAVKRERAVLDDPAVQDLLRWARVIVDPTLAHEPQQLLIRPPFLCEPEEVAQWADGFRRSGIEGRRGCFLDYLGEAAGSHAAASRFLARLSELRKIAATKGAYETLYEIQRRCDLVHCEPLGAVERAERVACMVRVLRFAREVEDRLEAPGDLGRFLAYFDDLSEEERRLRGMGEDILDAPPDDDGPENAVQVLTAHKAKGLEFDTVFVVRCRPAGRGAFPSTAKERDATRLHVELGGEAEPDNFDEERRLFYVACTRAKRRLVLLAKAKKSDSTTSVDYFLELQKADQQERPFVVRTLEDWRAEAKREAVEDDPSNEAPARPTAWMDGESARAKRRAAALVLRAESSAETRDSLDEAGAELLSITRRLAAIAHLRAASEAGAPPAMPPFVSLDDSDYEAIADLVRRVERAEQAARVVRALPAPLRLSFSKIKDYDGCPRCFYAKYVLRLDEAKSRQLTVGDVVHGALEDFYKEWAERDAEGVPLEGDEGLRRLLEIGERRFTVVARARRSLSVELAEDIRRQLRGQLERMWSTLHDREAHIVCLEQSVEFEIPAQGSMHRVDAKIDRIDQLSEGGYRVIDYKSGRAREALTDPKADDLQMGIYLMALRKHLGLPDGEPVEGRAEYWILESGERGVIPFSEIREDKVRKKITQAAEGMLEGKFERKPRDCKGMCSVLGA